MDLDLQWTELKCLEVDCKEHKANKIWKGPNALKNWNYHYHKHHPTEIYLQLSQQKFCTNDHSTITANTINK